MNYHILKASPDGKKIFVALHIPTPAGTNFAGKTFAECILEDPEAETTSSTPGVSVEESTAMGEGTLIERVVPYRTHIDKTNAQKRAEIDALYTEKTAEIQNAVQQIYKFWGYSRDVPE